MTTGVMIFAAFINISVLTSFILLIIKLNKVIEKNMESHEANLLLQEAQFEQTKLQTIIETQEHLFTNIANELHDNIGHKLTYLKLQMQQRSEGSIPTAFINDIGTCLNDIRDISRSLNGEHLLSNGFLACVKELVERTELAQKFTLVHEVMGEPFFLPKNAELILFRIVQEAFTNIHKHAQASKVILQLHYKPTEFSLLIVDDGVGFATSQIPTKSQGLANIKTRVQLLHGTCRIISTLHKGTTINILVPINTETHA